MFNDEADIRTVEVTSFNEESIQLEAAAKEVAQYLTNAYPNYPWAVGWHDGAVLCVKLLINPDYNYGWTIDYSKVATASELAKISVTAGGELLERLNLKRGAWNGEMPTQNIDGVHAGKANPIIDVNNVRGAQG